MANILQTGATWLAKTLKANASVLVRYTRDTQTVDLEVVESSTPWDVFDVSGMPVRVISDDFRMTASDLAFSGVQTVPHVGDIITKELNGVTETFEVMAPDQRHCYDKLSQGVELVAFTKRTNTTDAE